MELNKILNKFIVIYHYTDKQNRNTESLNIRIPIKCDWDTMMDN